MKHIKKIVIGLLIMLMSLTAVLTLVACGGDKIEGKFVLDDVKIIGLGEDDILTNLLEAVIDSAEAKEEMKGLYLEFKADGTAVLGTEGEDNKETLNYELKDGIITLKDSDGKDYIKGEFTIRITYDGKASTYESKIKFEETTDFGILIPGLKFNMQVIFKRVSTKSPFA